MKTVLESIIAGVPRIAAQTFGHLWYAPRSDECPLCHGTLEVKINGEKHHCICSLMSKAPRYKETKEQLEWTTPPLGTPRNPSQSTVLTALVEAFRTKTPPRFLILTGRTGVGKTYLAGYIWKRFGPFGLWVSPPMLSQSTQDYRRELLQKAVMFPLVVIDDIGRESTGEAPWHKQALYSLVDARSHYPPSTLLTVITTNLTPQQIEEIYGERLRSRLSRARGAMWAVLRQGKPAVIQYAWEQRHGKQS